MAEAGGTLVPFSPWRSMNQGSGKSANKRHPRYSTPEPIRKTVFLRLKPFLAAYLNPIINSVNYTLNAIVQHSLLAEVSKTLVSSL